MAQAACVAHRPSWSPGQQGPCSSAHPEQETRTVSFIWGSWDHGSGFETFSSGRQEIIGNQGLISVEGEAGRWARKRKLVDPRKLGTKGENEMKPAFRSCMCSCVSGPFPRALASLYPALWPHPALWPCGDRVWTCPEPWVLESKLWGQSLPPQLTSWHLDTSVLEPQALHAWSEAHNHCLLHH